MNEIPARQYFRSSLVNATKQLTSYGSRAPAACDLSLVSGPYIWHDEVHNALASGLDEILSRYPLPNQDPALLGALAQQEGVGADWIWLAPGADIAIEVILRQLLGAGDQMAMLCPSFPRFEVVADTIEGVTTTRHLAIEALPDSARLIVLCTPCNPTTEEIPLATLRALISGKPSTMFCIDAPFDWYGSEPLAALVREFPNVIVIKSFSKIGLAGLRLGYVLARPETLAIMVLGQSPFTVPALVQRVGLAVARRFDRIPEILQQVEQRWQPLAQAFGASAIRHSPVPFYLLRLNVSANEGAQKLMEAGVSVVKGSSFYGVADSMVRVAIGDDAQNATLIDVVNRLQLLG